MDEIITRKIEMSADEFEEKLGLKGITKAEISTNNCNDTLVICHDVCLGPLAEKIEEIITFTIKERKTL